MLLLLLFCQSNSQHVNLIAHEHDRRYRETSHRGSNAQHHQPPHSWCIVQSDNRPREPITAFWALHAAINEVYARRRGYGYVYAHLVNRSSPCEYLRPGATQTWHARAPTWCKVPLLAHVMLHGTPEGRRCASLLYLDTDAHVANFSLGIDEYLARARHRGDEALTYDNQWRLLFSSNYWFEPDAMNAGVLFVRNHPEACGLLRFWWGETDFPSYDMRSRAAGQEQEVMNKMYAYSRPWGARVRLMPTARFFRRDDHAWQQEVRAAVWWSRSGANEATYFYDDFIHHGQKRHPKGIAQLVAKLTEAWASLLGDASGFQCWCSPNRDSCDAEGKFLCSKPPIQATERPMAKFGSRSLAGIFSEPELQSRCPLPLPEPGTAIGFHSHATCCGAWHSRPNRYTHLNGTLSGAQPRTRCWRKVKWAKLTREVEEWVC